ncbi:MAG TPA: hypothetical protein VJ872_05730 [Nocardioides sp.]|nr:hypothetical protein [Nocardioides sp.]
MRILAAALGLLLATVLAPLVITGRWTATKVEHTDAYVATVAPLASDPALRQQFGQALGTAAAEQLAQRLPVGMPSSLGDLVRSTAVAVVNQPGFPAYWRSANRQVHRQFLAIMDGHGDPSGFVYVDATPMLHEMFGQLQEKGLPVQTLVDVRLQIPVASDARLAQQRGRYHLVTGLAAYGPWLWGLIVLAAIAIAPGWRGRLRAVSGAALAVAVGAVVVMAARAPMTSYAATHSGVGDTDLVHLILQVVLDSLGPYARGFAVVALPVAIAALLISLVPLGRRAEVD